SLRAKGVKVTGGEIATFNWIRNLASAMDDNGREVVGDYMQEQYDLVQDILGSYEGDPTTQKEVAALPATTAMFKLNPYGTAPLSALAGVKTNVPST
mgnify:CR=1